MEDSTWLKIISDNGKYIREAKGKFIQYKIIHRHYFTPLILHRMGVLNNNLYWICQKKSRHLITLYLAIPIYSALLEFCFGVPWQMGQKKTTSLSKTLPVRRQKPTTFQVKSSLSSWLALQWLQGRFLNTGNHLQLQGLKNGLTQG